MKKKRLLVFFGLSLVVLLAAGCGASSVTRTFSKTQAGTGEEITVYLTVSVTGGETYYVVDDTYPAGWAVTNTTGNMSQPLHVKFAVSQGVANTNHTYKIRAPTQEGAYAFSGVYVFEGISSPSQVLGQYQVNVAASLCIHESDNSPCDGCVSLSELNNYIDRWHMDNQDVTIRELIEAIGLWKNGGC